MKKFVFNFLIVSLFLTACKTPVAVVESNQSYETTVADPSRKLNDIALNGKVYASIWQQNSAEFRALCYQAFNIAEQNLEVELTKKHSKPLAIITDVDETILDNSPYAVTQALKGNEFDYDTWLLWTSQGKAVPYPGAVEFFQFAASKGVTIFYVTNRNENDKKGTLNNLKNLNFPMVDESHVVVMNSTSNKEERRMQIAENYDVVMFLGDNLGDFSEIFYKKPQLERNQITDANAAEFGKKFIILPNAGYGDWESALPGYNYKLSPKEKDSIILRNLLHD